MRSFVSHFVALAVSLLSGLPAAAADASLVPVPLAIDARGGVILEVRVNDAGPFRFMLDTGASRSIVSDDLARELRAPVVAKSEVVTSAGSELHLIVQLGSVAVAGSRAANLLAPVVPASRLQQLGARVRGVLGQDFLSAFNYTLDYRRARLTWDEALTCAGPEVMRLVAAEGRYVLRLDDGLRLVPDSGAEVAVLFRSSPPTETTATLRAIRLGTVTLKNVVAYNVERSDASADGLLPLHQFSRVSFAAGGACLVARR